MVCFALCLVCLQGIVACTNHVLRNKGHDNIVELLLSLGARINAPPGGLTPLEMASKSSTRTKLEGMIYSARFLRLLTFNS